MKARLLVLLALTATVAMVITAVALAASVRRRPLIRSSAQARTMRSRRPPARRERARHRAVALDYVSRVPKKRFKLEVRVTLEDGRLVTGSRRYRPCR